MTLTLRWKWTERKGGGGLNAGLVGGAFLQYRRTGRYMKACHIAKAEVRFLLVQTVTSSTGPKHFQMSALTVTGAASMCGLWRRVRWGLWGEGGANKPLQPIVRQGDEFGLQME